MGVKFFIISLAVIPIVFAFILAYIILSEKKFTERTFDIVKRCNEKLVIIPKPDGKLEFTMMPYDKLIAQEFVKAYQRLEIMQAHEIQPITLNFDRFQRVLFEIEKDGEIHEETVETSFIYTDASTPITVGTPDSLIKFGESYSVDEITKIISLSRVAKTNQCRTSKDENLTPGDELVDYPMKFRFEKYSNDELMVKLGTSISSLYDVNSSHVKIKKSEMFTYARLSNDNGLTMGERIKE